MDSQNIGKAIKSLFLGLLAIYGLHRGRVIELEGYLKIVRGRISERLMIFILY